MLEIIKNNKILLLVILLSLVGLILKLLYINNFSMAFTHDQGRDLLDLRDMFVNHKLRLIGATTSLRGVFYGPLWYWVAFPFFILTGGSPFSTLIPLLILSVLIPIIFFMLIKEKKIGFVLVMIYIFSSAFFGHGTFALNTNPIIYLTPIFLILLSKFILEEKTVYLALVYLLTSIFFHFEPVWGLISIPVFLISVSVFKKWTAVFKRKIILFVFLIPFLPQILFEIKHNFLQTKALVTLLTGGGSTLTSFDGNLFLRLIDRVEIFIKLLVEYSFGQTLIALMFLIISLIVLRTFLLKDKGRDEIKIYFLICYLSLLISFVCFVLYPYALWSWYLSGAEAIILTLMGISLYVFIVKVLRQRKFVVFSAFSLFILLSISNYSLLLSRKVLTDDAANLRNRISAIDIVYKDSQGKGLKIYNFAPYVYDYPYQYLIWWSAKEKYGYLPEQYAYLDDQPIYVNDKIEADKLLPTKKAECNYLIMEPFENQETLFKKWRGRFPEAIQTWEVGKTRIEKLCP